MGKLKLTVNDEKTRICKVPEGEFDFLRYSFGRMYSARTGQGHQSVPGARHLRSYAVAPVVAHQAQGQATQGRDLSTLAPLRALRARTSVPAWARRAVGEGVKFCPRVGCGRSACPVR